MNDSMNRDKKERGAEEVGEWLSTFLSGGCQCLTMWFRGDTNRRVMCVDTSHRHYLQPLHKLQTQCLNLDSVCVCVSIFNFEEQFVPKENLLWQISPLRAALIFLKIKNITLFLFYKCYTCVYMYFLLLISNVIAALALITLIRIM